MIANSRGAHPLIPLIFIIFDARHGTFSQQRRIAGRSLGMSRASGVNAVNASAGCAADVSPVKNRLGKWIISTQF